MSELGEKKRQQLLAKFRTIGRERLERLNNAFVELEADSGNQAAAVLLMREIHTLKGEARLMGYADITLVAHRTEDLLVRAKADGFKMAAPLSAAVLRGFDLMLALLTKQIGGDSGAIDLQTFVNQVDRLLAAPDLSAVAAPAAPPPSPPAGEKPVALRDLATDTTIRVNISRLESLTYLASEMSQRQILTEHNLLELNEIGDEWRRLLGHPPRDEAQLSRWTVTLGKLHSSLQRTLLVARGDLLASRDCLTELDSTVRELRLLPLSALWSMYPRAIRDLAVEQGKEVSVSIEGGEVEVDKQVLDQIGEPLLHLARNAIDHGIEPPAERERAGKPRCGTISFLGRQQGGHVEIVISDDGSGVDTEAVRRLAVERGIWRHAEAAQKSEPELLGLVWQSGFSTRRRATEVSGRGVGMDVVKDRIETLGGSVELRSRPGQGLDVVLRLPISVAMLRSLVFESGGQRLAVPSHAVSAVLEIDERQVIAAGAGTALQQGGRFIRLHELTTLLGQPRPEKRIESSDRIVIVEGQGQALALRVARVIGEFDLVERSLDPFMEGMRLFIGTAIQGHEPPILVLNVPEVMRLADAAARVQPAGPSTSQRTVLLVEDAELTRDMLVEVLTSAGLRVLEAANGQEAVRLIRSQRPDLLITDLEMPIMDGFQLIRELRGSADQKDIPIIVLTGRDTDEDKKRAAELGADAYLVKTDFQRERLLQAVERFLAGRPR